ncbi:hypothetical protein AMTRI_Chr03g54820 [Amborella trichopoda]
MQSAEANSGGTQLLNHVSPPKSSSLFANFGMDSGINKRPSSTYSKVQPNKSFLMQNLFHQLSFFSFFSSLNIIFCCMFYSEVQLEQNYHVQGSQ